MTSRDELFHLIHSLDKPEKRYFKVEVAKHGGKNYLRLFEAIEKQSEYDEDKLKNQFAGEKFVKQLSVTKNYLLKSILKILGEYHSNEQIEAYNWLAGAKVLIGKGLFDTAERTIEKVRHIAEKYQDPQLLMAILPLAADIIRLKSQKLNDFDAAFAALQEEKQHILALFNEMFDYEIDLSLQFLRLGEFVGGSRHPDYIQAMNDLLLHPLLSDDTTVKRPSAAVNKADYRAVALNYFSRADEAALLLADATEMAFANQHAVAVLVYIRLMNNLCNSLIIAQRPADALATIEKLRSLQTWNKHPLSSLAQGRIYERSSIIESALALNNASESNPLKVRKYVKDGLVAHEATLDLRSASILLYFSGLLAFKGGDFAASLADFNAFEEKTARNILLNLRLSIKIFTVVIHVEYHNFTTAEYSLTALTRFIRSTETLTDGKDLVVSILNEIVIKDNTSAFRKNVQEKLVRLEQFTQEFGSPFSYAPLFIEWLRKAAQGNS